MALKKKGLPEAFRQAFERSKSQPDVMAMHTPPQTQPVRGRRGQRKSDPSKDAMELEVLARLGLPTSMQNVKKVRLLRESGFELSRESMELAEKEIKKAHKLLTKSPYFVPNFYTLMSRFADAKAKQQAWLELNNILLLAPERARQVLEMVRGFEFYRKDVEEFLATEKGKAFLEELGKAVARKATQPAG